MLAKYDQLPLLLHLRRPSFNAITLATKLNIQLDLFHALGVGDKRVVAHASGICPLIGNEIEHRQQEATHLLAILGAEMILFSEDVRQSPMPETMNVAQFALPVENFLGPFA